MILIICWQEPEESLKMSRPYLPVG
jgi:hypothetical protein